MSEKETDWLEELLGGDEPKPAPVDKPESPDLQPALTQLGVTRCPICKQRVAVYLTKTKRPFINCGFCSARIFYNGLIGMRLLRKKMKTIKQGQAT